MACCPIRLCPCFLGGLWNARFQAEGHIRLPSVLLQRVLLQGYLPMLGLEGQAVDLRLCRGMSSLFQLLLPRVADPVQASRA